jgi:hypothetical protein
MPAGSYVIHYGGKIHYGGAKNEETVIQVWGRDRRLRRRLKSVE